MSKPGFAQIVSLAPLTPGVAYDVTAATGGSAWRTRVGYTRRDWFLNSFNERKFNGGEQLWETTFGTAPQSSFEYNPLPQTLVVSDGLINQGITQNTTKAKAYTYAGTSVNCGIQFASIILDRMTCVLHWRGRISGPGAWTVEATAMDGSFDPVTFLLPAPSADNDGDFKLTYRGSAKSIEASETHSTLQLRIKKTSTAGGQAYVATKVALIASALLPASAGALFL